MPALAATLARALDCETVVVRMRNSTHHWTSAQYGATGLGCLLEQSIALAAAEHAGPLIAADAAMHPLLKDHPLVASEAKVCSFAGIAAFAEADDSGLGEAVGVICALSSERREFGPNATALLESLSELMASLYTQHIELHRQARNSAALEEDVEGTRRLQRQFRQAERMAALGSWRLSLDGKLMDWSQGIYAIHELPMGADISIADAIDFFAASDRARVRSSIERAIETGESYDFEADFVGAKGTVKRVRVSGELEIANGRPAALVGVLQDISEKHRLIHELEYRTQNDALTGLPNRDRFNEKLASVVRSTMERRASLAVVLIELDDLQSVNDSVGRAAGDALLCRASAILRSNWLKGSFAARLGGTQLVLLLQDDQHLSDLGSVLDRFSEELAAPIEYGGKSLPTGASLGASLLHDGGACNGFELLENADRALYVAKRNSGARFHISCAHGCDECDVSDNQDKASVKRAHRAA
ncbi:diguanylate cyclase domain-containing protein [Aurantiacibacter flavus]|uniref:Diguanylate cyclase n=1 Tax=Aurantiacibacter flavus TaxID=3145232 RepID=A0ABV0CYD6_9SPHN